MFRALATLTIASVLFYSSSESLRAEGAGAPQAVHQLVGEDYLYAIDFLFFSRLAEGELRFSEAGQPNLYRAQLVGRTLGIASWLSGDRTQTYTSLMELTPKGFLRSIEHVAKIHKRRWGKGQERGKRQRFDYTRGTVFEEKSKTGVFRPGKEYPMPEGQQPVDMLTAFYNLRAGKYGALVRGKKLFIPTFAKGAFTKIEVDILTRQQQAGREYFPSNGLLLQVRVDPEIFEADSGILYVWFDDAGIPARGIVEDIIGMGDVKGYLVDVQDSL